MVSIKTGWESPQALPGRQLYSLDFKLSDVENSLDRQLGKYLACPRDERKLAKTCMGIWRYTHFSQTLPALAGLAPRAGHGKPSLATSLC